MTSAARADSPGVLRASGWGGHLLVGGTTPWRDWTDLGPARGRVQAGAQQLELLRRLNLAGVPSPELAQRVLGASAPGRGRPAFELVDAVDPLAFGPPPVDPAQLPIDELVRVATSLIADDVVAAGLPQEPTEPRVRLLRSRYRLVGDPVLADPLRLELVRRGRPPGGRRANVLVLGTEAGQLLVDAWTSRAFDEGAPPWRDWLAAAVRRDALPPRVNLVQSARRWSRSHPGRVHIVLDPARAARLVGVRRLPAPLPPLSADALDLARRVTPVLGLLASREQRTALMRDTLRPRLAGIPGPAPVLPGRPSHRNGQNTNGYSRPLLLWMVTICTRLRSLSRRSCMSSDAPRSRRAANQPSSDSMPNR